MQNSSSPAQRGLGRAQSRLIPWLCLTALLLGAVPVVSFGLTEEFPVVPHDGFSAVDRGSVEILVSEPGELESAQQTVVINHCQRTVRLLWIEEEGKQVAAGDVVAILDSSELEARAKERRIYLVKAEAALKRAAEDLGIQQLTNLSRISAANLKVQLTKLELEGYQSSKFPQERNQLASQVALAEETHSRQMKQMEFVRNMVQLGYRTYLDQEAQRLTVLKAEQSLSDARAKLHVLSEYAYRRKLAELQGQYDEAVLALSHVERRAQASILGRQIRLRARQATYDAQKSYYDRIEEDIKACVLKTPQSGEVVHARPWGYSSSPLSEGSQIRYLQPVVHVPNREQMQIVMRVHESKVRQVEPGMPAKVTVEAHPGLVLSGTVTSLSNVPLPGRYPHYERREYDVFISIQANRDTMSMLTPRMTGRGEVIANRRHGTLRVPVNSVVDLSGRRMVFVKSGDALSQREVEVGLVNDQFAEILSGLSEREEVVSQPRITCAKRLEQLETEMFSDKAIAGWAGWAMSGQNR